LRLGSRLAGASLLLAALAACAAAPDAEGTGEVRVFAASSLQEAFTGVAKAFETEHPALRVRLSFAGSQTLRVQIENGAATDVFASADSVHVTALRDEGLVRDVRVFAHNELVIVTPLDDPAGIGSLEDLVRARRLVVGTESVPIGRYTREMLRRAAAELSPAADGERFDHRVLARVVSEEANARLVRAKVELGEADAAVVYRTDARSDHVRVVQIPADVNVRADYWVALVPGGGRDEAAERFVGFLTSERGRAILEEHGFR
jgi:molybdate transport system substrate-binding protein